MARFTRHAEYITKPPESQGAFSIVTGDLGRGLTRPVALRHAPRSPGAKPGCQFAVKGLFAQDIRWLCPRL